MDNDTLHVQINNYDSYQAIPSCLDNLASEVSKVPVIRVYGALVFYHNSTKYAFNTLIHIHNVYPYVYVSCDYEFISKQDEKTHIQSLIGYLETALASSFKRKGKGGPSEDIDDDYSDIPANKGKRRFIASISLCKGVPVYGYRVGFRLFYKINFLASLYKTKFVNLFNDGNIILAPFGEPRFSFELYDAHIPYISQFLTDFNLFSCSWLQFKTCYFRYPVLQCIDYQSKILDVLTAYLTKFIENNVLDIKFARVGKSVLEIDIKSSHILNRSSLVERSNNASFASYNLVNRDVNLKSIDLIINEINYQSSLNKTNFEFNGKIMDTSDKVTATKWTNDLELRKLLDYSVKITNSIKNHDVKEYSAKFLENFNTKLEKYPTIFQVVDKEKMYLNSNVMMADLYKYHDVSELFIGHEILGSSQINTSSVETVKDVVITSDASDEEVFSDNEVDHNSVKEPQQLENGSKHPGSSQQVAELSIDIDDDGVFDDHTLNDSQIFQELTQRMTTKRKRKSPPEDVLSRASILKDFDDSGVVRINYDDPFYDKASDLPPRPLIFANKKIKVPYKSRDTIPFLEIENTKLSGILKNEMKLHDVVRLQNWEYAESPPTKRQVIESFKAQEKEHLDYLKFKSQLEVALSKSNDFKFSNHSSVERRPDDFAQLTNFLMEVHVNTNDSKLPNPLYDEVSLVFYRFVDSNLMFSHSSTKTGILVNKKSLKVECSLDALKTDLDGSVVEIFDNEVSVVNRLLELVETYDPDILSGFEINSMSWGYIVERFRKTMNVNILASLGRCKEYNNGKLGDRWGYTHTSIITVTGRYTLNVWRLIRKELNLNNYSFENCCYHIYHRDFPKISNLKLSKFLNSGTYHGLLFVLRFYSNKVNIVQYLVESQDLIDKNVEMSRLIGVDFNSNFYRGSQFKVESILGRLCKAENFLLNSPSKTHVHYMRALEQIPLIMEPESGFYKSPLIVLDFQSLYPSIIIAYNICYSTFVSKLHGFRPGKNPIGYLNHLSLPPMIFDFLKKKDCITLTPNGLVFVKSKIRKSILATMLQEILSLRINIKNFLSNFSKANHAQLFKVFSSRQLALKLIANVTYGYTSATFSGRMPNSDIADAIVATGREILSKSIDMIEASEFGCKVVYGDTDSLFVYLPGKSKDEAFDIGEKLAQTISSEFPDPVKLKFEKVYHPCVLLSKKRYVGNMYEFRDQQKAKFDAKGIETIRRDGIPAQQKIVEKALKILFDTSNLSAVKEYVVNEFTKILQSKVIIKDFCFAKEVRYGTYKNETYLPPGAIVAQKKVENDERSEPQYRERVPYVVYRDTSKARLKDRCISPEEFIDSLNTSTPLQLDYEYYITKMLIPPLERIFNLMGVDLQAWYKEIPVQVPENKTTTSITHFKFIQSTSCINCGKKVQRKDQSLCNDCLSNISDTVLTLNSSINSLQHRQKSLEILCKKCVGSTLSSANLHDYYDCCINQDCVNYYNKIKTKNEMQMAYKKADSVFSVLDKL